MPSKTINANYSGGAIGQGSSYPPSFSSVYDTDTDDHCERLFATPNYTIGISVLQFDTSVIPDNATITDATIFFEQGITFDADAREVWVEWYDPAELVGGISSADYTTTPVGDAAQVDLTDVITNSYIILSNPNAGISKTGNTAFRLHVSGGQPAGSNIWGYKSVANGTNIPYLYVTYTLPMQNIRPDGDIATTGWLPNGFTMWSRVDEDTPDGVEIGAIAV